MYWYFFLALGVLQGMEKSKVHFPKMIKIL